MAPAPHARLDKGARLKTILSFAVELETKLPVATVSNTGSLLHELQDHLSKLPDKFPSAAAERFEEIDRIGTSLWNLCTRLRRDFDAKSDNPQEIPPILLAARAYAFLLLNGAHESGKGTNGNVARLVKIGIKAAKSCLERKNLDLARKVLEKVGGYEKLLVVDRPDITQDDKEVCERLLAEYYVLRISLAWHQNELSIAEHMFHKATSSREFFDVNTAESLADVLYEMANAMITEHHPETAEKWLTRALDLLNKQEPHTYSIDCTELRSSVMQSLVKTYLALHTPEHLENARNMVALLENEMGSQKLVVLLLKLEVLSASSNEPLDSNSYSDILYQMTRTMTLNDNNFRLMMFHVRRLNETSPNLACNALDSFLNLRILKEGENAWFEKLLVTRIWIATSQSENPAVFQTLTECFSSIATNAQNPISSAATLAAHTLLWKKIESNYTQGEFVDTEKWCLLAMHPIFENSGEVNIARISRKMLLCAWARKDIGSAREIFASMPKKAQEEPMTRFLMYKIALRCEDTELASECLHVINNSTEKEPTLLYACCLDAQEAGDKFQVLETLQLVLEKHGYGASSTVHIPSLLRITISLMVQVLEDGAGLQEVDQRVDNANRTEASVEKLCQTFVGATISLKKSCRSTKEQDSVWTLQELDWFSKNSYNIAITHIASWEPECSFKLLTCCISFIDAYPEDIGVQALDDIFLRKIFCEFCACTAVVAMARSQDNNETRLQYYLDLRKHVDSYDRLVQDRLNKKHELQDIEREDLLQKLSILVAFDFEAVCQLKAWEELGEVILKSDICKNSHVYEIMADCVLSCPEAPRDVLISTLKKIVNNAWCLETFDTIKLAKYMRCLFQIAVPGDLQLAEQLLDQVCSQAEETAESDMGYPTEELEWIATTAFNAAIDIYCNGDDAGCQNWAQKALSIAHYCTDQGALETQLQTRLMTLKFGPV